MGAAVILLLAFELLRFILAFNNPFKQEMKEGKRLMAEGSYDDAKDRFEQAEFIADSLGNLEDFCQAKLWQGLREYLAFGTRPLCCGSDDHRAVDRERPRILQPENHLRAIEDWQQARNLIAQSEADDDSLLPRLEILSAYRQLADEAYDAEKMEDARAYYRAAQDMIAGFEQDGQPVEENLKDQIAQRLENISLKLGIDPDKQVASLRVSYEPDQSPQCSPAGETAPFLHLRRVANPSETSANLRTNEPTASSFTGSNLTAEQKAELKKALSTGKRFYSKPSSKAHSIFIEAALIN